MSKRWFLLIPLAVLVVCTPVFSQNPVLVDFTGGSSFPIFYGGSTGDVVGYSFNADANTSITHLGVHNDGRVNAGQDGVLDSPHNVGLWDAQGNLLCDVVASSAGLLVGEFYYEPCPAPVALSAGGRYVLGAEYSSTDNDSYFSGPGSVVLDGISNTEARFPSAGSLGFIFPDTASAGNLGRLGPNALYVPEPTSLGVLGLGLVMVGLMRRR